MAQALVQSRIADSDRLLSACHSPDGGLWDLVARAALARSGRNACWGGLLVPVSGNPARSLEFAMSHDLFSFLDSFASVSSSLLLVRNVAGD
ncbi:MAG TPA: hypothetical protein VN280_08860 [Variovorax sp.]|nr:hypothetical protein [Variovorax sp.]